MSTETSQAALDPSRSAYAEASAWLAQLHGPQRSAELEADFRSWLEASPQNAQAFEKVTDTWDALGSVNIGGLPRLAAHEPFERTRKSWNLSLAAAALAAVAMGVYWFARDLSYSTEIGEQRIVNLADGTRVSLNSATALDVDFSGAERAVRLEEGEALFEVAQDSRRPFVVLAGDRKITALGTSFVVRRESGRIDVTLLQGKVSVSASSPPLPFRAEGPGEVGSNSPVTLSPGQRLTVTANRTRKLDAPRPEIATAWRRGEVILDETPLNEAIAEMNRYDRTRLVIEDPAIDTLPVSGIYRTGNNQDFARAVATMYGLNVIAERGEIRLEKIHTGN